MPVKRRTDLKDFTVEEWRDGNKKESLYKKKKTKKNGFSFWLLLCCLSLPQEFAVVEPALEKNSTRSGDHFKLSA